MRYLLMSCWVGFEGSSFAKPCWSRILLSLFPWSINKKQKKKTKFLNPFFYLLCFSPFNNIPAGRRTSTAWMWPFCKMSNGWIMTMLPVNSCLTARQHSFDQVSADGTTPKMQHSIAWTHSKHYSSYVSCETLHTYTINTLKWEAVLCKGIY